MTHSCEHEHKTPDGLIVKCYHKCRSIISWQFAIGLTLGYPLEHFLWEHVWPFYKVLSFIGMPIH